MFVKAAAANGMEIHNLAAVTPESRAALLATRPSVREGDFVSGRLRALNASRAWIKHVRGAGFESVDDPPGLRLLCWGASGAEAGCVAEPPPPGGEEGVVLRCAENIPGTDVINPQRVWVDERPYEARARAMGDDVLAGSYETAMDT